MRPPDTTARGKPRLTRRAATALGMGWLGACALPAAAADGAGLLLTITAPGALRINNPTTAQVTIARAIMVERYGDAGWRRIRVGFNAIARCDAALTPTVPLAPGAVLDVLPWLGGTCGGQCPQPCRANIRYGGGRYRFVVTALPDAERLASPDFSLP